MRAALLSLAVAALWLSPARADDSAAPLAPLASEAPDASQEAVPPPAVRRFSLELNPLAIFTGRYSVNVEALFASHAAFVANPFVRYSSGGSSNDSFPGDIPSADYTSRPTVTGGGAELGVRYYSTPQALSGFFAGGAFILGGVREQATCCSFISAGPGPGGPGGTIVLGGTPGEKTLMYGFAIDLGGQYVSKSGFVIGGGGGWAWSNEVPSMSARSNYIGLPRMLFSIGQAL